MFRPTSIVQTLGSIWYFDDEAKIYVRTPHLEGPRAPGPNGEDWGGPNAQLGMQDRVEHPLRLWKIMESCPYNEWDDEGCAGCPHLNVQHVDSNRGIWAPGAKIVLDSRLEVV